MIDNTLSSIGRIAVIRLFILSCLFIPICGHADLYSWTDENGVKHFSNDPPAIGSGEIRITNEYFQNNKENDTKEIESPDLPKDSAGREKAVIRSRRTGSGPKVNITFKYYDFVSVNTSVRLRIK